MLKQIDKVCGSLQQARGFYRQAFACERANLECFRGSEPVPSSSAKLFHELLSCVRSNALLLYRAGQYTASAVERRISGDLFGEQAELDPGDQVFVRLAERAIYIRTPMLWTTNRYDVDVSKKRPAGHDREIFFRNEILHGIRDAPNFHDVSFDIFEKKLVHFLYVYGDNPASKVFCVDNDSHATKYVQDAVTSLLPGGDSPFSCSIYSSAALSSDVPESTFITVMPLEDRLKSDEELITFWSDIMNSHPPPE